MSNPTKRTYRLPGSVLLLLAAFFLASLLTYDPADGPASLVYPTNSDPTNLAGAPGAWTASFLFGAFGLGAYCLAGGLLVAGAVLLLGRHLSHAGSRLAGFFMLLVAVCTLAATGWITFTPGPVIGPGGYLGVTGFGLLSIHFQPLGAYIILGSLLAASTVLLAEDWARYSLLWMFPRISKRVQYLLQVFRTEAVAAAATAEETADASPEKNAPGIPAEQGQEEEDDAAIRIVRPMAAESPADDDEQPLPLDDPNDAETAAAEPEDILRVVPPRKANDESQLLRAELNAVEEEPDEVDYELPSIDLLLPAEEFCFEEHEKAVRRQAKVLEKTFADFGFSVKVVEIQTGPVIAQFEVQLERGLRLSKITGLADDLAIALKVPSVRIVAPIPGKNTVGIEVPNLTRQLVRLREVIEETTEQAAEYRIPIFLGKDVAGNSMICDLASLPHLLIAGRTGTGKSVCLNSIIVSMLMTRGPDEVRMLLIDPKMVELSPYKSIPHLMHPVVTHMPKAEAILAWAVEKMEERYTLLARAGVRHLSVYNQLGEEELRERMQPESDEEWEQIPQRLPYIVIVADEMADLMMTAAKEVETHIIRLAQKSRAVGIHLVLATQKPTVDIITGLIKSNLPARICFEVASRTDSRVVLDEMGADKLLGNGDMLFLKPGSSALLRGQGTYVSDDEINSVIDSVATSEPQFVTELVQLKAVEPDTPGGGSKERDAIYEAAVEVVIREGRGSVSLLQRALGVGYGRAARMIDHMAEDGIVGTYNGSQAREVLLSLEEWQAQSAGGGATAAEPEAEPAPPRKRAKICLRPARDIEVTEEELAEDLAQTEEDDPDEWNEFDVDWAGEEWDDPEQSTEAASDPPFEANRAMSPKGDAPVHRKMRGAERA